MQNDEAQKALSLANATNRVRAPVLSPLRYLIMFRPATCSMGSYENYRADTTDRCCPPHAHVLTFSSPTSLVRCL